MHARALIGGLLITFVLAVRGASDKEGYCCPSTAKGFDDKDPSSLRSYTIKDQETVSTEFGDVTVHHRFVVCKYASGSYCQYYLERQGSYAPGELKTSGYRTDCNGWAYKKKPEEVGKACKEGREE